MASETYCGACGDHTPTILGRCASCWGDRPLETALADMALLAREAEEAQDAAAEIARLTRELKEAREILRDLSDDEDAGIVWTGTRVVCAYCYATDRYDVEHNGDCPIERARRALVATPDTAGET